MQRLTSKIKAIPGAATQRVEDVVLLTRALITQTIILIVSLYLLFLLSTFIYGSFYFAFVPAPIHQGPVHLIFEPCQEKMGKCGFLNASVLLSDRNPILMTGKDSFFSNFNFHAKNLCSPLIYSAQIFSIKRSNLF